MLLITGVLALFVAFSVSAFCCWWIVQHKRDYWLDQPNDRSLHTVPVPRLGGVGIWSGVAVGGIIGVQGFSPLINIYCLVSVMLLLLVAFIDDWKTLSSTVRLSVQILAAILAVFSSELYISWDIASWIWPWVWIFVFVWGINLYNFMDGMDGFAALMAVIGFSALAFLGYMQDQVSFLFFNGLIVAGSAGFLCFNFPPARIFMGDSGSTILGFAMVLMSVIGLNEDIYPIWVPLVIFSPFWVDATVTLVKRLYRHERIWQPHRQHYYQRWVLAGYSHRQVTIAYGLVMLLCSASVIAWQAMGSGYNGYVLPLVWMLFYAIVLVRSERLLKGCQR
jgi:UDP-N-acetylmuramyl pentapeptide phosphotransferase/UDP-N-acetylglucosamine-1-phosphate transferase